MLKESQEAKLYCPISMKFDMRKNGSLVATSFENENQIKLIIND
jgi:hypothetical protein